LRKVGAKPRSNDDEVRPLNEKEDYELVLVTILYVLPLSSEKSLPRVTDPCSLYYKLYPFSGSARGPRHVKSLERDTRKGWNDRLEGPVCAHEPFFETDKSLGQRAPSSVQKSKTRVDLAQ
jgi:hypothetical protein